MYHDIAIAIADALGRGLSDHAPQGIVVGRKVGIDAVRTCSKAAQIRSLGAQLTVDRGVQAYSGRRMGLRCPKRSGRRRCRGDHALLCKTTRRLVQYQIPTVTAKPITLSRTIGVTPT